MTEKIEKINDKFLDVECEDNALDLQKALSGMIKEIEKLHDNIVNKRVNIYKLHESIQTPTKLREIQNFISDSEKIKFHCESDVKKKIDYITEYYIESLECYFMKYYGVELEMIHYYNQHKSGDKTMKEVLAEIIEKIPEENWDDIVQFAKYGFDNILLSSRDPTERCNIVNFCQLVAEKMGLV